MDDSMGCTRICKMPCNDNLASNIELSDIGTLVMTSDEYKTIYCLDYSNMNLDQCIKEMSLDKETILRHYHNARIKLAKFIVTGRTLVIGHEDDDYCNSGENCDDCHCALTSMCPKKELKYTSKTSPRGTIY